MRNPISASSLLVYGLFAFTAACGGDKPGDSGGSGTATGTATGTPTGTATGTPTGTATGTATGTTPPSSGSARVVNLIVDPPAIDIYLNGSPSPLVEDVPTGGNTDAYGADYVPFPPGVYTVEAKNPADDTSLTAVVDAAVDVGVYYTVIFYGALAAAPLGAGPASTFVIDDPTDTMAGMHHLKVFHFGVGLPDVDVWIGGTLQADDLAYSQSTGLLMTGTGAQTISLDLDDDGTADLNYAADLADNDWSYLYLIPDGVGGVVALHHVRAVVNTPLAPM